MARYPRQADDLVGPATDQYRIDSVLGLGGLGITMAIANPTGLRALSPPATESVTRMVGYCALTASAAAALGFPQLGGSYQPWMVLPATILCLGLILAALERGWALVRPEVPDIVATAQSVAIATALGTSIFWLSFSFYPLSALLFILGALFAVPPFGSWVPFIILGISGLHFVLAMWMLLGKFAFAAPADGVRPNPYSWPLAATSLVLISLLSIASAIQMRRRLAHSAT